MISCPKCGSRDIYDRWVTGRKLQRVCRDCFWKEPPRTPDIRVIKKTKFVKTSEFGGVHYEIYDKYGYVIYCSASYSRPEKAKEMLILDITKLNQNPDYAPCIGILWPSKVAITGEVVSLERGENDE